MALSSLPPDFSFFLPYEINNYWIFGKNTLYTEINRLPSIETTVSLQKRRRHCSRLLAKAAKWKIATSETGFSNLPKIVTVKEKGIQGYSLRRR